MQKDNSEFLAGKLTPILPIVAAIVCLSYYGYQVLSFDSKYYSVTFTIESVKVIRVNEGESQLASIKYNDGHWDITENKQFSMMDRVVVGESHTGHKLRDGGAGFFVGNKYVIAFYQSIIFCVCTWLITGLLVFLMRPKGTRNHLQ